MRRRPKKSGPAGNYAGRAVDSLAVSAAGASWHHRPEQEIDSAPQFYRR